MVPTINFCFPLIYFIPIIFQFVKNISTLEATVRLLPFLFILVFAVILNSVLIKETGDFMLLYLAGGILSTLGLVLIYMIDLNSSTSRIYSYSTILAIGEEFTSQAYFLITQAKIEPHQLSVATRFIDCT